MSVLIFDFITGIDTSYFTRLASPFDRILRKFTVASGKNYCFLFITAFDWALLPDTMIFQISYKEIKDKARNLPYEITIIISTEVYYVTRDCTGRAFFSFSPSRICQEVTVCLTMEGNENQVGKGKLRQYSQYVCGAMPCNVCKSDEFSRK